MMENKCSESAKIMRSLWRDPRTAVTFSKLMLMMMNTSLTNLIKIILETFEIL